MIGFSVHLHLHCWSKSKEIHSSNQGMAAKSQNCIKTEENMYWKEFESNRHQFFKMLVGEAGEFRHWLRIPRKFVNNFTENLSGTIHLRGPSGFMWPVQLASILDEAVLLNGWGVFAKDHCLAKGDVLVFRYDGNRTFNVLIFDPDGCEREGSYFVKKHMNVCSSGICVLQKEDDHEQAVNLENHMQNEEINKKKRGKAVVEEKKLKSPSQKKQRTTPITTDKKKKVCEDEDESNPSFVIEMPPDYISPGRKMCIPVDFAKKYMKNGRHCITLTVGGEAWPAKCLRYVSGNKYTKAVIYSGWREFRQQNKLKVGETCVFELTDRTKMLFNVRRLGEGSNRCSSVGRVGFSMRPLTPCERARAFQRADDFKSKYPFFRIAIQPAYLKQTKLYIPYKFVNTYLGGKEDFVKLQLADRNSDKIWIVKLTVDVMGSGQHKAQFRSWKYFAMDNVLQVGQVCIFELIKRKERLFNVHIK